MKKFIKKIFGIDKIEQLRIDAEQAVVAELERAARAQFAAAEAEEEAKKAKEEERIAKLSPKDRATEKKESYIAVLDTKVNPDNPRNGFFELDWNEFFIVELRSAGYNGESEEAIVDQWFQDLCRNIGNEQGVNMERRGTGFINVGRTEDGKTYIS